MLSDAYFPLKYLAGISFRVASRIMREMLFVQACLGILGRKVIIVIFSLHYHILDNKWVYGEACPGPVEGFFCQTNPRP